MNFETINTPADLVNMNDTPAVSVEQAMDVISEFNPAQSLALATHLVERLRQFHVNVSLKDNCKNPQAWACDAGILAVALNCLNEIEL